MDNLRHSNSQGTGMWWWWCDCWHPRGLAPNHSQWHMASAALPVIPRRHVVFVILIPPTPIFSSLSSSFFSMLWVLCSLLRWNLASCTIADCCLSCPKCQAAVWMDDCLTGWQFTHLFSRGPTNSLPYVMWLAGPLACSLWQPMTWQLRNITLCPPNKPLSHSPVSLSAYFLCTALRAGKNPLQRHFPFPAWPWVSQKVFLG